MAHKLEPGAEQLAELRAADPEAPVAALNLFQFRERAQYSPADEEYGTPAADVSGREALQRYVAAGGEVLARLGGRVVLTTAVEQVLIGPAEPRWDVAAIMYFPTRRAFVEMTMDPAFRAASRHRKAALAGHLQLHVDGSPWMDGPD